MTIQDNKQYKTFWRRTGSAILDASALAPLIWLDRILWNTQTPSTVLFFWAIATTFIGIYYVVGFTYFLGQTPGKIATGIKVLDKDGNKLSWKQAILRHIVPIIISSTTIIIVSLNLINGDAANRGFGNNPTLLIVFTSVVMIWGLLEMITMLTNKKRRAIHDFIAGTVVVRQVSAQRNPEYKSIRWLLIVLYIANLVVPKFLPKENNLNLKRTPKQEIRISDNKKTLTLKVHHQKSEKAWVGSPIVISLDNHNVNLIPLSRSKAYFDIDKDDMREKISWISSGDGILVLDKNNNDNIDNVDELFNAKNYIDEFLNTKETQQDSFDDLTINDDNPIYQKIKIWQDKNGDGLANKEELGSLEQHNIRYIRIRKLPNLAQDPKDGIRVVGSYRKENGSKDKLFNFVFDIDQVNAKSAKDYTLDLEAMTLPFSRGYGNLKAWHIAMSEDKILLSKMQNLSSINPSEYKYIDQKIEEIIYRWAGVENVTGMRGAFDAKKLSAMENITGKAFLGVNGSSDISEGRQLTLIQGAWKALVKSVKIKILVQGTFQEIFQNSKYDFATDSIDFSRTNYQEILNNSKIHYDNMEISYQKEFVNHIKFLLKSTTDPIEGLNKRKIDEDFAKF
jgi:uncharacterized RDD family membrane protein YckC